MGTISELKPRRSRAKRSEPEIIEPDWPMIFPDPADAERAAEAWRLARHDMELAGTFSPANAHALRRYAITAATYDRAAAQIAADGPVLRARKTGTPAHSAWWTVLRDADATLGQLEERLGLSPRSRGKVRPAPRVREDDRAGRYFQD